jgi:hypothetical protein
MIDTFGWVDGFAKYGELVELLRKEVRVEGVRTEIYSGNLYARGTDGISNLLKVGAGKGLDGLLHTHRFTVMPGEHQKFDLGLYRAVARNNGIANIEWVFDVPDPEETKSSVTIMDSDLMGPVMANPEFRDVAAGLAIGDSRKSRPTYDPVREEKQYGPRFRETARLITSGAGAVIWDTNLHVDPASGGRLRLRAHPAGLRMLIDLLGAGTGDLPRWIASGSDRARLGLKTEGARGVFRDEATGRRLLLWSEDQPRLKVALAAGGPVLVTPLVQAQGRPFVSKLVFPEQGMIDLVVGWAPVLVDLSP